MELYRVTQVLRNHTGTAIRASKPSEKSSRRSSPSSGASVLAVEIAIPLALPKTSGARFQIRGSVYLKYRALVLGTDGKIALSTAKTEAPDVGEDLLEDFPDGLEALMAVPVWFLSTWVSIHFRPTTKVHRMYFIWRPTSAKFEKRRIRAERVLCPCFGRTLAIWILNRGRIEIKRRFLAAATTTPVLPPFHQLP